MLERGIVIIFLYPTYSQPTILSASTEIRIDATHFVSGHYLIVNVNQVLIQ